MFKVRCFVSDELNVFLFFEFLGQMMIVKIRGTCLGLIPQSALRSSPWSCAHRVGPIAVNSSLDALLTDSSLNPVTQPLPDPHTTAALATISSPETLSELLLSASRLALSGLVLLLHALTAKIGSASRRFATRYVSPEILFFCPYSMSRGPLLALHTKLR